MVPKKITSLSHHLLNLFGLYGLLIGDICLSIIAYHGDKTGWFCHIRGKYFAIEWTWKQRKHKSDLPIKEEIWSGGSCPLVGTLIPLALRTDFSIEIVLPLASWIWTTCEGSADYNVFVLFCLLNVKMFLLFIYPYFARHLPLQPSWLEGCCFEQQELLTQELASVDRWVRQLSLPARPLHNF